MHLRLVFPLLCACLAGAQVLAAEPPASESLEALCLYVDANGHTDWDVVAAKQALAFDRMLRRMPDVGALQTLASRAALAARCQASRSANVGAPAPGSATRRPS